MFKLFKNKKEKRTVVLKNNDTLISSIFNLSINPQYINDNDLKMIFKDLSFSGADTSRKSVTEKKDLEILCDDEKIAFRLKECFNSDIVSQILETYLYGINVFEVNYKIKDGLYYPVLVQRDFRNFRFENGELKFYDNGILKDIPPFKAIYGLSRANFAFPYGDGLLRKLYFPVKLKNTSLKFWVRFLEKFGSPWAVAKTSFDAQGLAGELYSMLAGDAAVIDEDESIEITQPAKDSTHDKLISYCDNQISRVILGGNLTSQVSGGSFAATKTHNEIRNEIAKNDEQILLFMLKRAIKFFKEINSINLDIDVKLFEKEPNLELADRDLKLFQMGFTPTKEYINETYNFDIDEGVKIANKERLNTALPAFKHSLKKPLDNIDASLEDRALNGALAKNSEILQNDILNIIQNATSYDDAYEKMLQIYDLSYDEIEKLLFNAFANIELLGRSND